MNGDPFRDRTLILRSAMVKLKGIPTSGQLSNFIQNKIDPDRQFGDVLPFRGWHSKFRERTIPVWLWACYTTGTKSIQSRIFCFRSDPIFLNVSLSHRKDSDNSRFDLKTFIIQLYLLNLSDNYFSNLTGCRTSVEFIEDLDFIIDKFRCADLSRLFTRLINENRVMDQDDSAGSIECLPVDSVIRKQRPLCIITGLNDRVFPSTEKTSFIIPRAGGKWSVRPASNYRFRKRSLSITLRSGRGKTYTDLFSRHRRKTGINLAFSYRSEKKHNYKEYPLTSGHFSNK